LGLLVVTFVVHATALIRHWELVAASILGRGVSPAAVAYSSLQSLDRSIGLAIYATPVVLVAFVWWLASRYSRMGTQRISGQQYSSGLVAASMLLPVANVIVFVRASNELWRASDPDVDFEDSTSWQRNSVSPLVTFWQVASLAAVVPAVLLGVSAQRIHLQGESPELIQTLLFYGVRASLFGCLALLASVSFILLLDLRQQERGVTVGNRLATTRIGEHSLSMSSSGESSIFFVVLGLVLLVQGGLTLAVLALRLPEWSLLLTGQGSILIASLALVHRSDVSLAECIPLGPVQPRRWLGAGLVGFGGIASTQVYLLPTLKKVFAGSASGASIEIPVLVNAVLLPFLVLIVAPFLEEVLFRGLLYRPLASVWSPVLAIAATSVLFGLVHLNPLQIVTATILGIHCGVARWKSGSLVPPLIVHFFNNLAANTTKGKWVYLFGGHGWLLPMLTLGAGYILLTELPLRSLIADRLRPFSILRARRDLDWTRCREALGLAEFFHLLSLVVGGLWVLKALLNTSGEGAGSKVLGVFVAVLVTTGYWRGWRVFISAYCFLVTVRLGVGSLDMAEAALLLGLLPGALSLWMNRRFSSERLLLALQGSGADMGQGTSISGRAPRWTLRMPRWETWHLVAMVVATWNAAYLLYTMNVLSPPGHKIAMVLCFLLAFGLYRSSRTIVTLVAIVFLAPIRWNSTVQLGHLVFALFLVPGIVAVWKRRLYNWPFRRQELRIDLAPEAEEGEATSLVSGDSAVQQ
jgi:membrane protease YdiL (CAAX protease family)